MFDIHRWVGEACHDPGISWSDDPCDSDYDPEALLGPFTERHIGLSVLFVGIWIYTSYISR